MPYSLSNSFAEPLTHLELVQLAQASDFSGWFFSLPMFATVSNTFSAFYPPRAAL